MPVPSESIIQQYIVGNLKKHPNYGKTFIVAAYPNEGKRTIKNGARLKAQGMLAGMPDLPIFTIGGQVFFIEYKVKGCYLSANQKATHNILIAMGHKVETITATDVMDGYRQTWKQLEDWGVM